jgi:uncharacterized membrane protein HdeD (DUF308 family)
MDTFTDSIKKNSTLAIVVGILLIVVGFMAMGAPLIAGLSVALMVGWLFLLGGIVKTIFAVKSRAGFLAIIWGVLTLLAGLYMIGNPGVTLASLVLLLAIYLILSGVSEAILAFAARPQAGWGWALFSAIVSFALGIMIWAQFPITGALAIGILLGIKLLFSGLTLLMTGVAVRKAI